MPEWTRDAPTEPGYYWIMNAKCWKPTICEVYLDDGEFYVLRLGDVDTPMKKIRRDVWWQRIDIAEPDPPKEAG